MSSAKYAVAAYQPSKRRCERLDKGDSVIDISNDPECNQKTMSGRLDKDTVKGLAENANKEE